MTSSDERAVAVRVVKVEDPVDRRERRARSNQLKDPFDSFYNELRVVQPPHSPERMLTLSQENATHAACLAAKAADTVGHGWRFAATGARANKQLPAQLEERLNEICVTSSFEDLLFAAVYEEQMIGWSCWEICRETPGDPKSEIIGIFPVPAFTIRVAPDERRYVQVHGGLRRWFTAFGTEFEAPISKHTGEPLGANERVEDDAASELLVFQSYSPFSPYYGVPRWVSSVPAIAEMTAIRDYNLSQYRSGGLADRLITVRANNLAVAQAVVDEIANQFEESAGRGHVTVFAASTADVVIDVKFLSRLQGEREGQFGERREDLVREVLMAHTVPPYRIGWAELGSLGGSAAKEMLRTYRVGAIQPLKRLIERQLNRTLFGPAGFDLKGYRFELLEMDWEQMELQLEVIQKGITLGLLTPNEGRQMIGKDPVSQDGMDTYYMAVNIQPLDVLLSGLAEQARQALRGRPSTPEDPALAGPDNDPDAP